MYTVYLIAAFCVSIQASVPFSWSSCASNTAPIQVSSVRFSPDPMVLPGELSLTVRGNITRPMDSSELSLSLTRHTYLWDMHLPCLYNIGSCTYHDTCTLVDKMIYEDWGTIGGGIGTQIRAMLLSVGIDPSACPIHSREFIINNYIIHLPSIPRILSWLGAGDYTVKAEVKDNTNGETLLCLDIQLSLSTPSCWFCG